MGPVEVVEGRLWLGRETPGGSGADRVLMGPDGLRRIGGGREDLLRWPDVAGVSVHGEPRPDDLANRLGRTARGILDGVLTLAAQGGAGATDREPWRFITVSGTRRAGGPWRAGARALGDAGTSAADLALARELLEALVVDAGARPGLGDPDRVQGAARALDRADVPEALRALRH